MGQVSEKAVMNEVMNARFFVKREELSEELLASQLGLCFMELCV